MPIMFYHSVIHGNRLLYLLSKCALITHNAPYSVKGSIEFVLL